MAQQLVRSLLDRAGLALNGPNPWDIRVRDPRIFERVAVRGSIGLGEAYMQGLWDCPRLDELFARIVSARLDRYFRTSPRLLWLALRSRLQNLQTKARVWRAADVHYDLPLEVFEATFDRRLTGSCAIWSAATDLDSAQEAKLDLVCRKLGLESGAKASRIWDIGCGWGAFMGFAAEKYGASCVGVTISKEQQKYVAGRYADLPVEARLEDYRDFDGTADHIVSMGMFEHVGPKNYRTYFGKARRCLRPGGVFVLHTIWSNQRNSHIDPWIDKYIFPHGVLPSVGQIAKAVEGLFVIEDVHNFGADYDRTLMAWNEKFQRHRGDIAAKLGEEFCRMWEYYLLSCAGGFRARAINVGQFVLSPSGVRGGYRAPQRC